MISQNQGLEPSNLLEFKVNIKKICILNTDNVSSNQIIQGALKSMGIKYSSCEHMCGIILCKQF